MNESFITLNIYNTCYIVAVLKHVTNTKLKCVENTLQTCAFWMFGCYEPVYIAHLQHI